MGAAVRQRMAPEMPEIRKRLRVVEPAPVRPARRRNTKEIPRKRTRRTGTYARTQKETQVRTRAHAQSRVRTRARRKPAVPVLYWVLVAGCMSAIVLLLYFLQMSYTELSAVNRNMSQVATEVESLKAQKDTLAMQLEPYLEPSRMESLAVYRLGMKYPDEAQTWRVSRGEPAMQTTAEKQATPDATRFAETAKAAASANGSR